jgi:hypothetical protein
MKNIFKKVSLFTLLGVASLQAQNVVQTGVPYLLISPDARGAGLGDQGAATTPDNNSLFWNMSKLAFIEDKSGISVSYSPWLQQITNDVSITNLNWFQKLNNRSAYSVNVKYFSLGEIVFKKDADDTGQKFSPNEFTIDAGYAMQLSRRFSAGVVLRYINSNLASSQQTDDGTQYTPANTLAADISAFYKSKKMDLSGKDAFYTAGLNISNLGGKVSYTEANDPEFLPANLKLGAGLHVDLDNYNRISFTAEGNKLLVPTIHRGDLAYNKSLNDLSVVDGIFRSFNDSPDGETELEEIAYSIGLEYLYNKQFAFRAGYFHENENKGARQYYSFGLGIKMKMASLDATFLAPTAKNPNHPLKQTLRFSLNISLDAITSDIEDDEVDSNNKREEKKESKSKKKSSKKKEGDKN